ncbi:MAG: hypothetical protein FWG43_05620, partial [Clostridiales bacterium]|nr:hypothetical protein [Clostridiales bacterium]
NASPADPFFAEEELTPWEDVYTNNLSEMGVSVNSIVQHKIGTCLHIRITLDHASNHVEQIELMGIIRHVQTIDYVGVQYRLGVEFLPFAENLRLIIAKFVMKKQQQILRTEIE